MAYGRPVMISTSAMRSFSLPSRIDDDHLDPDHNSEANVPDGPCKIAFYVYSLKLVQILGEVLDFFYGRTSDQPSKEQQTTFPPFRSKLKDRCSIAKDITLDRLQELLALDMTLVNWSKSLPPHLLLDCDQSNSRSFARPEAANHTFKSAPLPVFTRQARELRAKYGPL